MTIRTKDDLTTEECLERLRAASLARVLLSIRCLPAAVPTELAVVSDNELVLATDQADVWRAGDQREVFTVQVDGRTNDGHVWSVTAVGIGAPVDPASPLGRAAGHRGVHLVAIADPLITGRRH